MGPALDGNVLTGSVYLLDRVARGTADLGKPRPRLVSLAKARVSCTLKRSTQVYSTLIIRAVYLLPHCCAHVCQDMVEYLLMLTTYFTYRSSTSCVLPVQCEGYLHHPTSRSHNRNWICWQPSMGYAISRCLTGNTHVQYLLTCTRPLNITV